MSDDVGYKKPPKEYRFVKGQCPNPNGRPRASFRNSDRPFAYMNAVRKISRRKVSYTGRGKAEEIALIEAALLKLAQMGLSGNIKALALFLDMTEKAESGSLDRNAAETSIIRVFGMLPDD